MMTCCWSSLVHARTSRHRAKKTASEYRAVSSVRSSSAAAGAPAARSTLTPPVPALRDPRHQPASSQDCWRTANGVDGRFWLTGDSEHPTTELLRDRCLSCTSSYYHQRTNCGSDSRQVFCRHLSHVHRLHMYIWL